MLTDAHATIMQAERRWRAMVMLSAHRSTPSPSAALAQLKMPE